MRRRLGVALVGALVAAVMAGCGRPAGTDGDLTDDWRGFPEAKPFVPAAGVCHLTSNGTSYFSSYTPLDCATTHRVETLFVGTFTGEHANCHSRSGQIRSDQGAQVALDHGQHLGHRDLAAQFGGE